MIETSGKGKGDGLLSSRKRWRNVILRKQRGYAMAQTRPEIKEIVEKSRAQLVGLGIHPVQVYLYGSHAKGTATEGSDVDLIVVSPDFFFFQLSGTTRDTWYSRSASPKTDPRSRQWDILLTK
jgi:nucleotidyltransferase-like protein